MLTFQKGDDDDDAENLDLVLPIYNLLKYSLNCCDTTGSLWFYPKDESTTFNADIVYTFKTFGFKTKLLRNTVADGNNRILKNATIALLLKYLSNI